MRSVFGIVLATYFCILTTGCARSDSERAAERESKPSMSGTLPTSTAAEMLQSISRCYAGIESVQVDVVETMSLNRSDSFDMTSDPMAAAMARPNRLSLTGAAANGLSFHADGQQLWTVLGDRYSREPCPATLALIADDPMRRSLLGLSRLFLLRLLGENAGEAITRDVTTTVVMDDELLDGQLTHRLQFTQPDFDWEMWVAAEQPRLIQQIVIDMSKQLGAGLSDGQDARITTTIRFQNWRVDPRLDESAFAYRPTDDARQVDHVMGIGR